MRRALLLPLALAGCGGGGEAPADRPQHMLVAAVRAGLYAVKAAPGGALALFSDVRLIGRDTVCGTVDAQDGGGKRRFAVVAGGEPTIEQPGNAALVETIERTCRGRARAVTSRNPGYSDIVVAPQAR